MPTPYQTASDAVALLNAMSSIPFTNDTTYIESMLQFETQVCMLRQESNPHYELTRDWDDAMDLVHSAVAIIHGIHREAEIYNLDPKHAMLDGVHQFLHNGKYQYTYTRLMVKKTNVNQ
jgi:hypothetical protein